MEEIIFAKCPVCGEELIANVITETIYDGDRVKVKIIGECPNHCNEKYYWTEIFEYVDCKDITTK